MKNIFFLILILFTASSKPVNNLTNLNISARNYIVMDAYSNEVLEGKDINSCYSVASISKIMTAILAIESEKLFNVVTVDEEITNAEGSSLYLQVRDQITILDLVYGLLLRSGNDAANLIAENVSKDIISFVNKMNLKAKEIGMNNTIFHNPSGLDIHDEGNISTCYDMALLMSYCLNNELFVNIVHTKSYHSPLKGTWVNKNKLLRQYEYLIGGKTGYTYKAKRTLINAAEKDGQRIIVVTFSCGNDFAIHKSLFEKYFNTYSYIIYFEKGLNFILDYTFYSPKVIGLRIPKEEVKYGIRRYYIKNDEQIFISFVTKNNKEINGDTYSVIMLS